MDCTTCNDAGWVTFHSALGASNKTWRPCPHQEDRRLPNFVRTSGEPPVLGRDYVLETDVCLYGTPAINGRCGDLDCVCAPIELKTMNRVVEKSSPDIVYHVIGDDTLSDSKMRVIHHEHVGKVSVIVKKEDWLIVDVPVFPI